MKILLIDSADSETRRLAESIVDQGDTIRIAHDPASAQPLVADFGPDVVLLGLAGGSNEAADAFLRSLRQVKSKAELPVLVRVESEQGDRFSRALALGANDSLPKDASAAVVEARLAVYRQRITDLKLLEELRRCDSLTGLYSADFLFDRLLLESKRISRDGTPISLVVIDLDFFGQVNELHGRRAGDTVLREVAALLKENCRESDVLCRYGGDTFAIILPNTVHHGTMVIGEKLRTQIGAAVFRPHDAKIRLTCSVGAITRRFVGRSEADLQQFVDELLSDGLYAVTFAKRDGGNQIIHYRDVMRREKKLVLVDDDIKRGFRLRELLSKSGYQIYAASTAAEGVRLIKRERPSRLLLQIFLAGSHGFSVLQTIQHDPALDGMHIVVYAAKECLPEVEKAKELGAAGFWREDTDFSQLVELLEHRAGSGLPVARETHRQSARQAVQSSPSGPAPTRVSFKFWGTRGSIPVCGPGHQLFGGRTISLEITDDRHTIIVDAGTGCQLLGAHLMREGRSEHCILIGHAHWDHIQGFPFFMPAYVKGNTLNILGPTGMAKPFRSLMTGVMDLEYFPVPLSSMGADIVIDELIERRFYVGQIEISWAYVYHPGIAAGFKFKFLDKTVIYITDNELRCIADDPAQGIDQARNMGILDFVQGVDFLIHEAQYFDDEYREKIGWGHSSVSAAAELAVLSKASQWLITHHDPLYTDDMLLKKQELCRAAVQRLGGSCSVRCLRDMDEVVFE